MVQSLPDAQLFAALGDPTRLALVARLASGPPSSTTALASETSMTRQGLRKHLDVLQQVGLVRAERQGRQRQWSLDARPLREVRDWAASYRDHWEAAFDRLQALLDEEESDEHP